MSASEVADRVVLLLIEAAIGHEQVGHHLLADLLRRRAAEVLRPWTAEGSGDAATRPPATDAPRPPASPVDIRDGRGPRSRSR